MIGDRVRAARKAAGLSLRETARRAYMNAGYLSQIEHGDRMPSPRFLRKLSDVLGVELALPEEVPPDAPAVALTPDAPGVLAGILAGQRRLDDVLGSRPVLPAAVAHANLTGRLIADATGELRVQLLDVGGQWAQFTGWLHTATGDYAAASRWFGRALEHATETGDHDMIATALSFKGYVAVLCGRPGPAVGVTQAALREGRFVGGRAYDALQEARGHAMLGDRRAARDRLGLGADLAAEAAEHTGPVPPWQYYRSPGFFALERSLVYRLLGDSLAADDLVADGMASLPVEQGNAEWTLKYLPA